MEKQRRAGEEDDEEGRETDGSVDDRGESRFNPKIFSDLAGVCRMKYTTVHVAFLIAPPASSGDKSRMKIAR